MQSIGDGRAACRVPNLNGGSLCDYRRQVSTFFATRQSTKVCSADAIFVARV